MSNETSSHPVSYFTSEELTDNNAVGLLDMWGILRRRYPVMLSGVVVGALLAGLYCFQATPQYTSETQILLMKKNANLPTQGVESSGGMDGRAAEDLLATHMQILSSQRVIRRALKQRNLENLPSIREALKEDGDPAKYVSERLTVTRGGQGLAKGAHVLTVTFRHAMPEDSAAVLGAVIESYQDFLGETFQDASGEAIQLIAQAKDDLGAELAIKETAYREFREQSPLLWTGDASLNVAQVRLVEVEKSLAGLRIRRGEILSRLATVDEVLERDVDLKFSDLERMAIISDSDIHRLHLLVSVDRGSSVSEAFQAAQPARTESARTEYDRLLALRLDEQSLLQSVGNDHPKVLRIRQSIREVTEMLDSMRPLRQNIEESAKLQPAELIGAYRRLLQSDLADLDRRQREFEKLAEQENKDARALVSSEVSGQSLRNDLTRTQLLYDTVIDRLREINLVKDYGGYVTELLSPVELGTQVSPRWGLTLVLGTFAGLVLGTGAGFLVDTLDSTFRSPEDIQRALELPVLVHVPDLQSKKHKRSAAAVNGQSSIDMTVLAHHWPKSREAEVFRGLRTSLYFMAQRDGLRVIQITSPHMGDGKSTLVSNLATSIAHTGKKVLAIDADLRRPRLHRLFGVQSASGLTTVLSGETELFDAVQPTEIENLFVLPAGPVQHNPAELLALPKLGELLELVREQYDYVLVDTPPVLAVSDPVTVAGHVDGVILHMKIHKHGRSAVVHAKELLAASAAEVLGLTINSGNQSGAYGYGAYGSYGYGYGQDDGKGSEQYYEAEQPVES